MSYAVTWYHNMVLCEDPFVNRLVQLVLEGGKRILTKPFKNWCHNNFLFIKVDSTCLTQDLFVCSYSHMRDFLDINKCQI